MKYILLATVLIATSAVALADNDKEKNKPWKHDNGTIYTVPDGGSTIALLGTALGGIVLLRRIIW